MTALDWFYEKLVTGKFTGKDTIDFLYETAKQMEKEQIKEAYKYGLVDEYVIGSDRYYNQTYKK